MKSGTGKIRFLLPVLGFLCFLGFQFLKSEPDQITDVNTFLKTRLSDLVRAFDENGNGELSAEELLSWYHAVDIGDKANELKLTWENSDRNGDSHISLHEYLEGVGFLSEDPSFLKTTRRRFVSADKDQDSLLSKEEFAIFLFPELSPEMRQNLYNEEMSDRDVDGDGNLSLHEYLGLSEEELSNNARRRSIQPHIDYFRARLDSDHNDVLTPDEILAWISDDKRHLREKSEKLLRKLDKNRDGNLNIESEVLNDFKYFSEHELTRYGDLLYYQDEL